MQTSTPPSSLSQHHQSIQFETLTISIEINNLALSHHTVHKKVFTNSSTTMSSDRPPLDFAPSLQLQFEPYLPPPRSHDNPPHQQQQQRPKRPFTTLTFATSLDSALSLRPGQQTALSGPESKAMTHFLRSRHDAILVGAGTAVADDPSLNCRMRGVGGEASSSSLEGHPRPVVVDLAGRWDWRGRSSGRGKQGLAQVMELARQGKGKAPWIVVARGFCGAGGKERQEDMRVLEELGGDYVEVDVEVEVADSDPPRRSKEGKVARWEVILEALHERGITSVMVEGGGYVIDGLLAEECQGLVDSVVVTVAPVWLGQGSVVVRPRERRDGKGVKVPVGRLREVRWVPLGEDVVVCGRLGG